MSLFFKLMHYQAFVPPRPDLSVCLDAECLDRLRVKNQAHRQLLLEADQLLLEVETANPAIGIRPELRAHLRANTGQLVALVPDGADYLFRFVQCASLRELAFSGMCTMPARGIF